MAEHALKISLRLDVGTTGLKTPHLPTSGKMPLDGYVRQQHAIVHEDDRKLAVRVAKTVRAELRRGGIEV